MTWTHCAGVLDEHHLTAMRFAMAEDPKTAEGVLRRVHELREQLYHHLADCIDHHGGEQQIGEGSPLHRAFADAVTVSGLAGTPARWTLEARGPLDLTRVLALHALDLVQTMPPDRLRRCDDDGCGWLFLDTRNASRRVETWGLEHRPDSWSSSNSIARSVLASTTASPPRSNAWGIVLGR